MEIRKRAALPAAAVILVMLVGVLVGCSSQGTRQTAQEDKEPYIIGAVFDVTGPASPLGTPERDTVQMIADQINEKGGINGHPVKFVIYDNGSEETKCVMSVQKLIEADKAVAIIGPSTTGTTLAVAPLCEKAKIPLISCAAGNKITTPVKPFVFKTAQVDIHAMAKALDYLNSKGIKKVAFISDSNAFGASGLEQMKAQAPGAGISLVGAEVFGGKDTDMTAQLSRIKAKNPDAVVCWGTNPGPAIVARNMKQLGMKMPLVMSHGIANRKFIELAGDAADGVVFPAGRLTVAASVPDDDPQKQVLLDYLEQFKSAYSREADSFGGYAWDAARLVLAAMEKVGNDPAKIRDEIEKTTSYVGVSGVFNFSTEDHNGLSKDAFVMVGIENGDWVLLK